MLPASDGGPAVVQGVLLAGGGGSVAQSADEADASPSFRNTATVQCQRPPEEASNGLFQLLQDAECRDLESDSDDEIFHDCNLSSESDKDERLHRMRVCAG